MVIEDLPEQGREALIQKHLDRPTAEPFLARVEVHPQSSIPNHCSCRPIAQSAPQHQETAMQFLDQGRGRLRQPKVLPSSASWRCYPGNLGSNGESQLD